MLCRLSISTPSHSLSHVRLTLLSHLFPQKLKEPKDNDTCALVFIPLQAYKVCHRLLDGSTR